MSIARLSWESGAVAVGLAGDGGGDSDTGDVGKSDTGGV